MGKGKKKDKKKGEVPKPNEESTSSISLSGSSTSVPGTAAEQEGLTRGPQGKKAPCPTALLEQAPPSEPKLQPQPSPALPSAIEEEFEGLGIGSSRKKRPRKKKEPIPEPAVSSPVIPTSVSLPGFTPPGVITQHSQAEAVPRAPAVSQSGPWGAPRPTQTSSAPPPRPPQTFSATPAHTSQHGYAHSAPLQSGPPQFAPPPQSTSGSRGQGAPPPRAQDVRTVSTPLPQQKGQGEAQISIGGYRIPEKIIGKSVPVRNIAVLTNYLPMKIKALIIHRYDVSFIPEKPKKLIPKAFIKAKEIMFPKSVIAFDQMKNCYALQPLPNVTQTERLSQSVEVEDNNGKIVTFEVAFKGTGTVNLGTIHKHMAQRGSSLNPPTEAIQCVDVILRQGTLESYVKAGRQFFKRPQNPVNLGDGLEMWTGLFQSAIFTSNAFVNVDVAHKGFPKEQPLISALTNDFRLDPSMPLDRQRGVEYFTNFLKGLRVMAMIGGDTSVRGQKREFICNELVRPPRDMKFTKTVNGKEVTHSVEQYFAAEKGIRLRYPTLNCVWVGPRDKHIYYPIELLTVSYGQAINRQLNDRQLSTMVKEAATPPNIRKQKIEEVISSMNYSKNEYFKQFGLDIGNEFFQVNAKVLKPPTLDTGGGGTVMPRKGAWQASRLLKPEALDAWAFIAIELDPRSSNSDGVIKLLMSEASRLGMRPSQPQTILHNVRMSELKNRLLSFVDSHIKFVVIIVPTRGKDSYHKVKQTAERDVGILTQCIKEFTATRKMNPQTAKNILLKINSKLMGVNQALDRSCTPRSLQGEDVMVVGADVTHPSPDQSSVPSIAAVAASFDAKCFMYNIQLSIQTPKKEMIVEFEDMMLEHLQTYQARNKTLPKKIFVFRDGVSEGQFEEVMRSELSAVHKAYRRLSVQKPEVLFLLVQKRHHTRLFVPKSPENVEPGTVVDTEIVHPRELDFYMVSHQAIKGTARPTRYHAVCNDGRIPHDEVEQLTYYLCHLYARCMRSVSYPTPTYYAHLACMRARSLTFGDRFDNRELERQPKRLRVIERMLRFSRMFFV